MGMLQLSEYLLLKLLNAKGEVINTLENLPFDVYDVEISSNGKFLFYSLGEYIEDAINPEESGARIIDLRNNSIFYEIEAYRIRGLFKHEDQITINAVQTERNFLYMLNELTSDLYKINEDKVSLSIGHLKYLTTSGDTLSVQDFTRIK